MEFILSKALLRPWKESDAASIARHANNKKISDNLRDGFPYPYTIEDARTWLSLALNETRHILLAIEVDGEAAGGIAILYKDNVYRFSAEIGYWLGESHWNKGITSEAIRILSDFIFENTGIVRIQAEIFSPNIASMKAVTNAGYLFESINKKAIFKNGEFFDLHVYCKVKEQ